jgi:predicted dehydrogenase
VHIWTDRPGTWWTQGLERPKDTPPCPPHIDWNLWLGPAPVRPYHPCYHPVKWRGWWDFGTGALGDIACHAFDGVFWALHLGQAKTFEIEALTSGHNNDSFPLWSIITYQIPARGEMPPVKLVWYDGGKMPERPKDLEPERKLGDNGNIIVGDKATMLDGRIIPETKMKEMQSGLPPKTLPRSPGIYAEYSRACRGGEPCGANFPDFAGPLTEMVLAANLAVRTGKKIVWDVPRMKCTNEPEVNNYVRREYRKGWTL